MTTSLVKLKCWSGNYNGDLQGLIAANSKKKAAELVRTSLYDFNQFWKARPLPTAPAFKPFALYVRPFDSGEAWHRKITRIQRQRTAGYRLPASTVCITRPGPFSNPYRIGDRFPERLDCYKWFGDGTITLENCLPAFSDYAENRLCTEPRWLDPLLDADYIACWCRTAAPCHGDIILQFLQRLHRVP